LLAIQIGVVVKNVGRIAVEDRSSLIWEPSVHLIIFSCRSRNWTVTLIVIVGRRRSHGGIVLILLIGSSGPVRIVLADGGRSTLCRLLLRLGILIMVMGSGRRPHLSFILVVVPRLRGANIFLFSRGRARARIVVKI
jgi:hypothetical protein